MIRRYAEFLPVTGATPVVTLLEGNTPLLPAPRLSERVGAEVYLKIEGLNPTGSFKDRGMTVAISKALEAGSRAVVCASTGNTSASAAAYAARAGMTCVVLVPEGHVALGKLAQALVHGAQVLQVRGNFDAALVVVRELPVAGPGRRCELGEPVPDRGPEDRRLRDRRRARRRTRPALHPGRQRREHHGVLARLPRVPCGGDPTRLPRMLGFQAAGAAPIVAGHPIDKPETIATAIRIGNPASWSGATEAAGESGGAISAVTDEQILDAYHFLAEEESVFCEPASAAAVAGLLKADVPAGGKVVCVLTGSGLKDPDTAIGAARAPEVVDATLQAVLAALKL